MNNFGYCYIFDYSTAAIYEAELTEEEAKLDELVVEEFLDRRSLNIKNCYVMFTENKLSVEPIKLKDDESVSN